MTYATARKTDADAIPVIDISPLRDGSDPVGVASALHAASQGLGFIYITGHGIPDRLIKEARRAAYGFFRSSDDEKDRVRVSSSHRGWISTGGAKMQDDAKPDLKESFIWGWEPTENEQSDDHPLRGANRWPADQPGFQDHAMTYFAAVHGVAHHLMRGFALGLSLEEDFFLKTAGRPLSRTSYVYYPAQPEEMGADQYGVGPHTDFGVLTVLCQDDVGGLQVQDAQGDWIEAPPIPGSLVVNVGDLLGRWTAGAYKSTPHRVVNSSGRERMSLVLAYDPNPETMIDPREVFAGEVEGAEAPITCGDYLIWRFGKAFKYRN